MSIDDALVEEKHQRRGQVDFGLEAQLLKHCSRWWWELDHQSLENGHRRQRFDLLLNAGSFLANWSLVTGCLGLTNQLGSEMVAHNL